MAREVSYENCRRGISVCSALVHSDGKIVRFDIGLEGADLASRLRGRHPESILVGPTGADKSFSCHAAGLTSQAN